MASEVKRVDGVAQSLELERAVDTFATDASITIPGITYGVDPTLGTGTDFDDFASSTYLVETLLKLRMTMSPAKLDSNSSHPRCGRPGQA